MHRTPCDEFPSSRLAALWREVPLTGPHMVRKIEAAHGADRRMPRSRRYGFIIRKASGAVRRRGPSHLRARGRYTAACAVRIRGSRSSRPSARAIHRHPAEIRGLHRHGAGADRQGRPIHGHRRQRRAAGSRLLRVAESPTSFPAAELRVRQADPQRSTMQRLALRVRRVARRGRRAARARRCVHRTPL